MRYFAVTQERGPSWNHQVPLSGQDKWGEHAAFMNALVEDGAIVLGGPLAGGPRVLLIFALDGEEEIRRRLAADPWVAMDLIRLVSVEPWEILLGN
jgi:uncharacterized protein YciI